MAISTDIKNELHQIDVDRTELSPREARFRAEIERLAALRYEPAPAKSWGYGQGGHAPRASRGKGGRFVSGGR